MTEKNVLTCQVRTQTGTSEARKLRAAKGCPAVVYGAGLEPLPLEVNPNDFLQLLSSAGENALINLHIETSEKKFLETRKVIVRELQYHPLGDRPLHIDFYQVSMDRPVTIEVPLTLVGESPAVADKTGSLSQHLHALRIECLPAHIPPQIEVDISGLDLGSSVHVKDLPIPTGATVLHDTEMVVVGISALKAEEEEEKEAEAPPAEEGEPELIGREKKVEEKEESGG